MIKPNNNMYLSEERSDAYNYFLEGDYEYYVNGVTNVMVSATRIEYLAISSKFHVSAAMDEILENKWFIHTHDLEDLLN